MELNAWDPQTDDFIRQPFSVTDLSAKADCKRALLQECGLEGSAKPLLGVVARFDYQKGLDLLAETIPSLAEQECNLVILGSGSAELEETYRGLSQQYSHFVHVHVGFDNALAHRILQDVT